MLTSSSTPIYDLPAYLQRQRKLKRKQIFKKHLRHHRVLFSMFYRLLIIVLGSKSMNAIAHIDDAVFIQDQQVKPPV
jgi:hypothetical protein